MVIGICKVVLSIEDAFSLKEKRSIVKSIIGRIKSRYNASIAEVDSNDAWKSAVLGIACVTNESAHADSMMSDIVSFIERDGRAVLVDYSTEIIHV